MLRLMSGVEEDSCRYADDDIRMAAANESLRYAMDEMRVVLGTTLSGRTLWPRHAQ